MIQTAVQKGDWVYVYGENGNRLFTQFGQLMGFTGTSVSIKKEVGFTFMIKRVIEQTLTLVS